VYRGQQEAFERAALPLAADRVRSREQHEQRSDRNADLEGEVHRLALLEEVEEAVRCGEVRHCAQEQAESKEQAERAAP